MASWRPLLVLVIVQAFQNEGHPWYWPVLLIGLVLFCCAIGFGFWGILTLVNALLGKKGRDNCSTVLRVFPYPIIFALYCSFMIAITLPDGSVRQYENPLTVLDIAKDISEGFCPVLSAQFNSTNGRGFLLLLKKMEIYASLLGTTTKGKQPFGTPLPISWHKVS